MHFDIGVDCVHTARLSSLFSTPILLFEGVSPPFLETVSRRLGWIGRGGQISNKQTKEQEDPIPKV